jgi:HEAT repeat protein
MANGSFDTLFQNCVAETGPAYVAARDQLLALGEAAAAQLTGLTSDNDWRRATTAQILLGWLRNRPLFEEALAASSPTLPEGSKGRPIKGTRTPTRRANVFTSYGETIVPLLLEIVIKTGLAGDDHRLQPALLALDSLRDSRAVMPLIDLAERTDSAGLQLYTLAVLGTIGDERAADVAQRVFANRDKSSSVRGAAAVALGQLRATSSTPALLAVARDPNESQILRENAVHALGYMGDLSTGTPLSSLLDESREERISLALGVAVNKFGVW